MQVILLERIGRLGQMGDVVKVRPGFARNFLLPQNKALRATKENMSRFENERAQLEVTNLERKQEAEAVSKKLNGLSFVVLRQAGDSGQLYGSVSTRDIADFDHRRRVHRRPRASSPRPPDQESGAARCARQLASRSRDQGRCQRGPYRRRGEASGCRRECSPGGPRRLCRRTGCTCGTGRACCRGSLRWRVGASRRLAKVKHMREGLSSRILRRVLHYLHGSPPNPRLRQRIP